MGLPIFNGQSAETIVDYLERHFDKLEDIISAIQDQDTSEHYARRKNAVQLDGAGNGTIRYDVPPGFDWILQRVTVTSTANGVCQFFIDTTNLSDLVEQIGSSILYSDAFDNNLYVPGGSPLLIVFTGAGANGQATVNLQLKMIKREVHTHPTLSSYIGDM